MKFMTFNTQHCLNFLTQKIDFDLMAKVIRESGADVVALQEIRGKGELPDYEEQVEIIAKKAGYPYYYFGKAIDFAGVNPYGNGVISKFPLENTQTVLIPDPEVRECDNGYYETRCVIKTRVNGVTLLATHFGLNPDEQRNAVKTVLSLIDDETVFMGDLNLTPDNEILKPIQEKLCDTVTVMKGNILTFRSDEPYEKIDYIFYSPTLKLKSAEVIQIVSSDHRPVIAEFEL